MSPRKLKALTKAQIAETEELRKNASAEELTTFEEDDDPLRFVGEPVDDEESK